MSSRQKTKRFFLNSFGGLFGLVIASLLVLLLAYVVRPIRIMPASFYLPFHMILELSGMIVSFAVFTTAWYGYKQTGDGRDMLIGVTFLATGVADLFHTLSYLGMPDFFGVSSPGKAAAYWLLGRFIVGVGLLGASLIRSPRQIKWLTPRLIIPIITALIVSAVAFLTIFDQTAGNLFFDPVTKLTPLKIGLEFVVVFIYIGAFFSFASDQAWEPGIIRPLRIALVWAILAELSFMLYQSPYGVMNALGHIFKTVSYYFILRGLFASAVQKPYSELSKAKDQLDNLYAHEQEHRIEMERSFSRIGSALSSSLRLEEALDQIADLAADMLYADWSIVDCIEKEHEIVRIATRAEEDQLVACPSELAKKMSDMIVKDPKTILINNLSCVSLINESCEEGPRSMLCAPLMFDGKVLGMISVYAKAADMFDDNDVTLMEGFASHAAVAMHNAISFEHESRIADALQRAILSATTTEANNFEIAYVYEPAMNEALIGGDFYDVIELSKNKIGLVIGDVSGKGLKAAVYTAMVKYSLRAYANQNLSSLESVKLLDSVLAGHTASDIFVTMFYGVLDTDTGELNYTNAGHEEPVYSCDGSQLTLPPTGPALGLALGLSFTEGHITLKPKSTLLLYTDGISEARHDNIFLGTEGIAARVAECYSMTSEEVAKHIYSVALDFSGGTLKDDVAILAVRALG